MFQCKDCGIDLAAFTGKPDHQIREYAAALDWIETIDGWQCRVCQVVGR